MGFIAQLLGKEPKGFYNDAKQFYQPNVASTLKPTQYARDGYGGIACERVTALTARTPLQWGLTMVGVVITGVATFVALAVIKKNEKFEAEVIKPLKKLIS